MPHYAKEIARAHEYIIGAKKGEMECIACPLILKFNNLFFSLGDFERKTSQNLFPQSALKSSAQVT